MNSFKKLTAISLALAVIFAFFSSAVCATDASVEIAVADISFDKYFDKDGVEREDSGTVIIEFSKLELTGQLTLMLSTEEITDTSAAALSKIIYINQIDVPSQNVISFPIDKARISAAIGSEEIDGATLYLKVNGTGGSDAVAVETSFCDPYKSDFDISGDGELTILDVLMAIELCLENEYNSAVDLNEDGKLTLVDVLRLLKMCSNV